LRHRASWTTTLLISSAETLEKYRYIGGIRFHDQDLRLVGPDQAWLTTEGFL
jgi:hypothetical protein